jgi:hypothetical protein
VLFGTNQSISYPQAMSWQLHGAGIQLISNQNKFANKLRSVIPNQQKKTEFPITS